MTTLPFRSLPLLLSACVLVLGCKPNQDCDPASRRASADVASSAPARPTSPKAASSATQLELQQKLAEVMLTRAAHQQIVHQASSVITQALANSGQPEPAGLSGQLDTLVGEALPYEDVLSINGKVYGQRFSPEELAQLIAFYQTETGTKLLKQQTAITKDVATRVSKMVSQRWPGLMQKHGLTQ